MPKQPKALTRLDQILLALYRNPQGLYHRDLPCKPSSSLSSGWSGSYSVKRDPLNAYWERICPTSHKRPDEYCNSWAGYWVRPKHWTKVGTSQNHRNGRYYLTPKGLERLAARGLI